MRAVVAVLLAIALASCSGGGTGGNAAVDECVAKVAGWPGNEDNTRAEFLRLFDPSRATIEDLGGYPEDGHMWPKVRVAIPRIADGYYERRHTHQPLGDEAVCVMFRRRDVWITA